MAQGTKINLIESFNNYFLGLEQDLLDESAKTDFITKFGDKALTDFDKAKQRLKNNNMSVDYGQYLKYEPKEFQDLILSLYDDKKDSQRKRMIQGTDKEVRGKYNYLGEKDGYKVYQPLDYLASMDLGVNTGWCTTGRYGHYGHPEFTPSVEDAKEHWRDYTRRHIKLYYFLNPETMYGEYALALYPKTLKVEKVIDDYYISSTNFELFNAKDDVEYSAIKKLPLDLIDDEIKIDYTECDYNNGLFIKGNTLVNAKKDIIETEIPNSVTSIGSRAFYGRESLLRIEIPNSVTSIGEYAFFYCSSLEGIKIPNSVTSIGQCAFCECSSLESINISDSVASIGFGAFYNCSADITIHNSKEFCDEHFDKNWLYGFEGTVRYIEVGLSKSFKEDLELLEEEDINDSMFKNEIGLKDETDDWTGCLVLVKKAWLDLGETKQPYVVIEDLDDKIKVRNLRKSPNRTFYDTAVWSKEWCYVIDDKNFKIE